MGGDCQGCGLTRGAGRAARDERSDNPGGWPVGICLEEEGGAAEMHIPGDEHWTTKRESREERGKRTKKIRKRTGAASRGGGSGFCRSAGEGAEKGVKGKRGEACVYAVVIGGFV